MPLGNECKDGRNFSDRANGSDVRGLGMNRNFPRTYGAGEMAHPAKKITVEFDARFNDIIELRQWNRLVYSKDGSYHDTLVISPKLARRYVRHEVIFF